MTLSLVDTESALGMSFHTIEYFENSYILAFKKEEDSTGPLSNCINCFVCRINNLKNQKGWTCLTRTKCYSVCYSVNSSPTYWCHSKRFLQPGSGSRASHPSDLAQPRSAQSKRRIQVPSLQTTSRLSDTRLVQAHSTGVGSSENDSLIFTSLQFVSF